ncbi:MAG: hypothetical protein ACJ741_01010, partial [Pyrinomonadaceae bacterium]
MVYERRTTDEKHSVLYAAGGKIIYYAANQVLSGQLLLAGQPLTELRFSPFTQPQPPTTLFALQHIPALVAAEV